jgi:mannose-6-phosphate isomerase-like protein (cupin superfamily)
VVVEGRVTFSDGKQSRDATAGDVVYVGPNEPHKFTVAGDDRCKMVCIHQSPEFITNWLE